MSLGHSSAPETWCGTSQSLLPAGQPTRFAVPSLRCPCGHRPFGVAQSYSLANPESLLNPATSSLRIAILVRRLPFEAHTKHKMLIARKSSQRHLCGTFAPIRKHGKQNPRHIYIDILFFLLRRKGINTFKTR